jgi:hypothetical protein
MEQGGSETAGTTLHASASNQNELSPVGQGPIHTLEGYQENNCLPNNANWTDDWSIPFDYIDDDLFIDPFFRHEEQGGFRKTGRF